MGHLSMTNNSFAADLVFHADQMIALFKINKPITYVMEYIGIQIWLKWNRHLDLVKI